MLVGSTADRRGARTHQRLLIVVRLYPVSGTNSAGKGALQNTRVALSFHSPLKERDCDNAKYFSQYLASKDLPKLRSTLYGSKNTSMFHGYT
jgi:hypothetical protein